MSNTFMNLSGKYMKGELTDDEYKEQVSKLQRDTYVQLGQLLFKGEISEDEFVERYNRLIADESEKHHEPYAPHEHI